MPCDEVAASFINFRVQFMRGWSRRKFRMGNAMQVTHLICFSVLICADCRVVQMEKCEDQAASQNISLKINTPLVLSFLERYLQQEAQFLMMIL